MAWVDSFERFIEDLNHSFQKKVEPKLGKKYFQKNSLKQKINLNIPFSTFTLPAYHQEVSLELIKVNALYYIHSLEIR